jgi:hypothetical protein
LHRGVKNRVLRPGPVLWCSVLVVESVRLAPWHRPSQRHLKTQCVCVNGGYAARSPVNVPPNTIRLVALPGTYMGGGGGGYVPKVFKGGDIYNGYFQ